MADERSSRPEQQLPFVAPDAETRARLEAQNGLRQFDRLVAPTKRARLLLEDHLAAQLVDLFNAAKGGADT